MVSHGAGTHKVCFSATRFHDFIVSWLLSTATLVVADGGKFMLRRSYLVVFGLPEYRASRALHPVLFHESGNSRTESAEIVVIHFLTFGAGAPTEFFRRTSTRVSSLIKQFFYQPEILLFRTNGGDNGSHLHFEELQDTQRLAVDGFH